MAKTLIDHERKVQDLRNEGARRRRIEELIELCSRALSKSEPKHYVFIAHKLKTELIPLLESFSENGTLDDFDEQVSGDDKWHWTELQRFLDNSDLILSLLLSDDDVLTDSLDSHTRGYVDGSRSIQLVIERALESCLAVAENVEAVQGDLVNTIDVLGFNLKLGEQFVNPRSTLIEGPAEGVSLQAGSLKTLFCGQTGFGKSTGLEREAEDFYLSQFLGGQKFKIFDLVDLGNGENWYYDVPQQQNSLKWILEKQDIEAEVDFDDRDVEIYVPLTPGITEKEFPFDTDDDRFKVKFFTVPASSIRKPLLVQLLLSRLTPQEKNELSLSYEEVEERFDDWALEDLADQIRENDDLSEKKQRKAVRVLRSLQNRGFIRTKDDPHTIDWDEVSKDTETITLFSQSRMETDLGRFMCVAILTDRLIQLRRSEISDTWPEAVLLMREMWQVVPHQRRDEFDERIAAIQEALGGIMSQTFRRNRHIGVHLLCDTQEIGDLLKPVREMFNRYVVYSANKDTVRDIFSWTQNDKNQSFWRTLNTKKGQAGIIGQVGESMNDRRVEYLSPVAYAPPTHHHHDKDSDPNGWKARVNYVESEELRVPAEELDIDDSVPDDLVIHVVDVDDQDYSPERHPVRAFVDQCLVRDKSTAIEKLDIRKVYNKFRTDHDLDPINAESQGDATVFGRYFSNAIEDIYNQDVETSNIRGTAVYMGFKYNWLGDEYRHEISDPGEVFEAINAR